MKYWWQNVVKDYLTFSAKERTGLITLAVLGAIVFAVARLLPVKDEVGDRAAFQKELAQLTITIDSSRRKAWEPKNSHFAYASSKYAPEKRATFESFTFDPNTLDAAGWRRLGIGNRTIETIGKFVARGFKFKQPEDLKKIYGLKPADAERLIPYVRIAAVSTITATETVVREKTNVVKTIDVNQADTTALIALPGIGSKLAARIINFRERLGGFVTVEQVAETYGISDTTFQLIRPRLLCSQPTVKKLNVNTADAATLKTHPYIKWNLANALFNYRQQHGNFTSLEDLRKIDLMTDELYKKLLPYLSL